MCSGLKLTSRVESVNNPESQLFVIFLLTETTCRPTENSEISRKSTDFQLKNLKSQLMFRSKMPMNWWTCRLTEPEQIADLKSGSITNNLRTNWKVEKRIHRPTETAEGGWTKNLKNLFGQLKRPIKYPRANSTYLLTNWRNVKQIGRATYTLR